MKFLICLKAVIVAAVSSACAQTLPQLIPPSPTAYSLGKYGDLPVGNYTGVPDISIPIYLLKDGSLSIDVSLSYHGSGVKVDEQASFVGLGWSLNAGGVITRTIKGRADGLNSNGELIPSRTNIPFYNIQGSESVSDYIVNNSLQSAAGNAIDNAPDEFFFNFLGKSGKFFFNNNGDAILEKDEALDIKWQYISPDIQKFVVRDEMGITYEFSDYETAYFGNTDGLKITAWYLSKITTPDNRIIDFEYYYGSASDNYSRTSAVTVLEVSPAYADIEHPVNAVTYSTFGMSEIRLKKIESQAGSVELKYKPENRKDYWAYWNTNATNVAWSALDSIIVYRPDNIVLKKTKFTTSYFEADDIQKYNGVNSQSFQFLNYRLRLDAIQDFNEAGDAMLPPFTFSYLGDNDPAVFDVYNLPYRLSSAQDHWGYYNRAPNTHLFPGNPEGRAITCEKWVSIFQDMETNTAIYRSMTNGANRDTDTAAVKACMLHSVSYPTGGFTLYDFESNKSANFGGVRIKNVSHVSNVGEISTFSFSYTGYGLYDPRDYYYKLYTIDYQPRANGWEPNLIPVEYLNFFGIPHTGAFHPTNPANFIKITAMPQAILGAGSRVGYSSVTVSQSGNGRTSYSYYDGGSYPDLTEHLGIETGEVPLLENMFKSDYVRGYWSQNPGFEYASSYITSNDWPYPDTYSNNWKRGMLIGKTIESDQGDTIRTEEYRYHRELLAAYPGYVVQQLRLSEFVYSKYYIPHSRVYLDSSVVVEYSQSSPGRLTTSTRYYYDNPVHLQPTRIETYKSDGKKRVVLTTYPSDYAAGTIAIDNMVNRHLLAYPIESLTYVDSSGGKSIIQGSLIKYRDEGSGLKAQELVLETPTPIDASAFKVSNRPVGILGPVSFGGAFLEDNRYKPVTTYNQYDIRGNLLQATGRDGIVNSYIWGYNYQYPVAKVMGADYNTIQGFVDSIVLNDWSTSKEDMQVELNKIRLALGGDKAWVSTYTYLPMIGMTSECNQKGETIHFDYDNNNRLKQIRDQNQSILKQFDYKYSVPTHNNPIWASVSTRCVQDANGDNTGEEEEELKDINPNSPTYNQVQWVLLGETGACPAPVYVVVNYDNCWSDGMDEYCDLYFYFYSDAGLTVPVSVTDLQVNVTFERWDMGQHYVTNMTFNCNGYQSRHDTWRVTGQSYTATHLLAPGNGYKY